MIICFFKRQIEILIQQRWFQCDMAFKRLEDKDNREVVFTICNEESKKSKDGIYS